MRHFLVQLRLFDCALPRPVLQRRMHDMTGIPPSLQDLVSSHATSQPNLNQHNRRKFLSQIGGTLAAGALTSPVFASAQSGSEEAPSSAKVQTAASGFGIPNNPRIQASFAIRLNAAIAQALVPIPSHQTNGDQQRYSDGSATYTKVVLQDSIGLVNPAAYRTFTTALASGKPSDFENIIIGGPA